MNKNEITPVQIAVRIVIIIIIIVVLLLVSFAMVRFVPKVISSLGNFRSIFAGKELMEASLDEKTISQGDDAVLTYKQIGGTSEGNYTLNYSCAHIDSDTHLEIHQGNNHEMVLCDEPLTLDPSASSSLSAEVTLHPTGESISYDQTIDITISHINGSSTIAKASTVLTVLGNGNKVTTTDIAPTSTPVITSKPVPVRTTPTRPSTSYYSSAPAHLVPTLQGVTVDKNARATVTFYVTNNGGRNSGNWTFNASLPRLGQTAYYSPYQSSIPPRGSSVMYLTFDNAEAGDAVINVQGTQLTVRLK